MYCEIIQVSLNNCGAAFAHQTNRVQINAFEVKQGISANKWTTCVYIHKKIGNENFCIRVQNKQLHFYRL